jgi:XRE family transcriptional regulator, regulator of sulfur utilization
MAPRTEPQPGLGKAIREFRNERGFSQEKLGHLSEIHPTWISHIESGRNNPAWGSVKRIAAALEVRLSELALRAEELEDHRSQSS